MFRRIKISQSNLQGKLVCMSVTRGWNFRRSGNAETSINQKKKSRDIPNPSRRSLLFSLFARSAPCALSFLTQATTARSKRQASPLFMTGERLYRLIFLTTLFLTLITSSQVCSHLKLSTIGSCAAIESFTCLCARLIVLKNLLLLVIA